MNDFMRWIKRISVIEYFKNDDKHNGILFSREISRKDISIWLEKEKKGEITIFNLVK